MLNRSPREMLLRDIAMRHLAGVGNRKHEWHEWSGYAYHVRRRLTEEEQKAVGPVIDLRGTDEAKQRLEAIRHLIPTAAVRIALEEIQSPAPVPPPIG